MNVPDIALRLLQFVYTNNIVIIDPPQFMFTVCYPVNVTVVVLECSLAVCCPVLLTICYAVILTLCSPFVIVIIIFRIFIEIRL